MTKQSLPFVPASEMSGKPHLGVAMALEALIRPITAAEPGDTVAIGASLVLTPDDLLFSDAGLSLYRLKKDGRVSNSDILDSMAQDYHSRENKIIRSLHFMLNSEFFFDSGLRPAALELSPKRKHSLSLEFIMLGNALLLCQSDLRAAFLNRVNGKCLGDVVRSLWYPPTLFPDRKAEFYAAKTIKAFLEGYMPLHDKNGQVIRLHVPFPQWHEVDEALHTETLPETFPLLNTWNVSVA